MNTKKVPLLLLLSAVLVFSGCFSPWKGDSATITINLGGDSASGRAADYPPSPEILSQLEHTIKLTGPSEPFDAVLAAGQLSFHRELSPGIWHITVQAVLDKELYATGSATTEINAGQNKFVEIRMTPPKLTDKLVWVDENADDNRRYIIDVTEDETLDPQILDYDNKVVEVILRGGDEERIIDLSINGALFTVQAGVTLILENNITLKGHANNNSPLVIVNADGALQIDAGAKITGNTNNNSSNSSHLGGGVFVADGLLTMNGGAISGNTAAAGGGAHIEKDAVFIMNGGEISGNTARDTATNSNHSSGGGVHVHGATFIMQGGTISGNTAYNHSGGLYVGDSSFTKTGGTIYGYSATDELSNKVLNSSNGQIRSGQGHAIYSSLGNSSRRVRDTTSNTNDNLTFDGTGTTPVWTGTWD